MSLEEIDIHFDKYSRSIMNVPERFWDYIIWPKGKSFDHKSNIGFVKSQNPPSSLLKFFSAEEILREAISNI